MLFVCVPRALCVGNFFGNGKMVYELYHNHELGPQCFVIVGSYLFAEATTLFQKLPTDLYLIIRAAVRRSLTHTLSSAR
jgi:hypothetical protein